MKLIFNDLTTMQFTQDNKLSFDRKVMLDRRKSLPRVYVNIPLGGGGGGGPLDFRNGGAHVQQFFHNPK